MFAPEIIVAGSVVSRSEPPADDEVEGDGPERAGEERGRADAGPGGLPRRLLGDHQFEMAYQTAREWLGSKPANTRESAKGATP